MFFLMLCYRAPDEISYSLIVWDLSNKIRFLSFNENTIGDKPSTSVNYKMPERIVHIFTELPEASSSLLDEKAIELDWL